MDIIDFGLYLRELQAKEGIRDDAELARLAGVSTSTISRIMRGKQKASPDTLKKIAPFLGVTYQNLLQKAGYIEEVIDHGNFKEYVITDTDGKVVDIIQELNSISEDKMPWVGTAFRAARELSEDELRHLEHYANLLLKEVQDKKNKK